jgi:RNA polymerase sigma-70 factor (ECF subfamily)
MTMPPHDFWLQGAPYIAHWFLNQGIGCKGSRLVATMANGQPAFASYKIDPAGGWAPWSVQVLDVRDGAIVGHHNFLDTSVFEIFGLPLHLDPDPVG